jgi:hypothetical protein
MIRHRGSGKNPTGLPETRPDRASPALDYDVTTGIQERAIDKCLRRQ